MVREKNVSIIYQFWTLYKPYSETLELNITLKQGRLMQVNCKIFKMVMFFVIRISFKEILMRYRFCCIRTRSKSVTLWGLQKKNTKYWECTTSVGNLHASIRSVIDTMQLVLLCKEEDFKMLGSEGPSTVFGPLIKDLQKLKVDGIFLGEPIVKV